MRAIFGSRAKPHGRAKQPATLFRQRRAGLSGYTPAGIVSAVQVRRHYFCCRRVLPCGPSLIAPKTFGSYFQGSDDEPQIHRRVRGHWNADPIHVFFG
jgi:hypothetical protein